MQTMLSIPFNLFYSPETTLLVLIYFMLRYFYGCLKVPLYTAYLKRRNSGKNEVVPFEEKNGVLTALETPEILINILEHLTIPDLLQCSLVNAVWRKQSRKLLREKKHCVIVLKSDFLCIDLQDLHDMLEHSTDLPFIGVHFQVVQHSRVLGRVLHKPWPLWGKKLDMHTRFPLLFQRLPVQYLFINYPNRLDCLCDEFLGNLLQLRAGECTEYLEIIRWPKDISFNNYLRAAQVSLKLAVRCRFTSLKTCKADCREWQYIYKAQMIREIVDLAPNLTKLYGIVYGRMLMEGSSFVGPYLYPQIHVRKHHLIKSLSVESHWELYNLVKTELKLEILSLCPTIVESSNLETIEDQESIKVDRILKRIIESSQDTLVVIYLYPNFLDLISKCVPLVNLRQLFLRFHPSYPKFQEMCSLLKGFEFQRFLPGLAEVTLYIQEEFTETDDLDDDVTAQPLDMSLKFQCLSVKTLKISNLDNVSATFYIFHRLEIWTILAEIFPNVQALSVPDNADQADLWDHVSIPWRQSLESLTCVYNDFLVFNCFWKLLIELLEKLSFDIGPDELDSIDHLKFREYTYAATRMTFLKEFGSLKSLTFQLKHQMCAMEFYFIEENLYERFEVLSSWMEAKFPDFKIQLDYRPCSDAACNPLFLPVGIPVPANSIEVARRRETRAVCLKAWSEIAIADRGRLRKFGDTYRFISVRIFHDLRRRASKYISSWRVGALFSVFLLAIIRLIYTSSEFFAEIIEFFSWLFYTAIFGFFYFLVLQWDERHGTNNQNLTILTWLFIPTVLFFIFYPLALITDHCWAGLLYLLQQGQEEELFSPQQVFNFTCKNYSLGEILHNMNHC